MACSSRSASAVSTGPPWRRGQRSSRWQFAGLAYTLTLVLIGANLPTPLYRIYQRLFGFSTGVLTAIFVTYVVGVILGLLVAGGASDRLGRRPVLVPAAVLGVAGGIAFACANGIGWLLVGRALTGLTTGVVTSVVPAALVDVEPRGNTHRAALVASAATVGGLACGPMLSALLLQYGPWPIHLVYVLYAVAFVPVFMVLATLEGGRGQKLARPTAWLAALRPRQPQIPVATRGAFRRATVAFVSGWVGTALFFSLGPTLAASVLHTTNNVAIAGVVLAVFVTSAVVQLATRRSDGRLATIGGLAMFAAGMGLVPLALVLESSAVLVVAALAVGGGQGLSHRAAQDEITRNAPPQQRGRMVAAFFIAGYFAVAVLMVGLGLAIDDFGLLKGLAGFALVVSTLALVGLGLYLPRPRTKQPA